ncbi:MAG: hypothetical protein J6N93_01165, partial [Clostridia bacterium]|nr:hypothetical protein [Clostridia bacterium]
DVADGDKVITAMQIKKDLDYEVVVATSFGTFKRVMLETVSVLARARKGVKIVDLGLDDDNESVVYVGVVEYGSSFNLLIEDENENPLYASIEKIPVESRTSKGKSIAELGFFRAKIAFPFYT